MRTLGWTWDEVSSSKYIAGTPDDRYRPVLRLAIAVLRPLAIKMKMTFSTVRIACYTKSEEMEGVLAPGRSLSWTWSSKGKTTAKSGSSRWYDTHRRVQCVRVDSNLKHKFDGVLYSVVGYCWDDNLHTDVDAKRALAEDGLMAETAEGSDASETTNPESDDVEDFLGLNRGRGCPLSTAPQEHKHTR